MPTQYEVKLINATLRKASFIHFNSTSLFSDNHVKDGAIEKRDDGIMEQLGEISNEINELKLDLGE